MHLAAQQRGNSWPAWWQLHTCMLSSAHSCRKRSSRARGVLRPLALVAVRQQQTRPHIRSHLRSPEEMNWSISTWAPLAKSPNWASHRTRVLGSASEIAVLEAQHRLFGQRRVDHLELRLVRRGCGSAGCSRSSVVWSMIAEWRWLKVPRTLSWPDRRTGDSPRRAGVAKARCSAVAQSMPSPASMASRRLSSTRATVRWASMPSGMAVIFRPMSLQLDPSARRCRRAGFLVRAARSACHLPSSQSALLARVGLAGLELGVEELVELGGQAFGVALGGDHALVDQALGVDLPRRRLVLDDARTSGAG